MPTDTRVKICGLRDQAGIDGAVAAGANYVGFVFFPKSPRHVTIEQAAALVPHVPVGVAKVGLFVSPDNAQLDATLDAAPLDIIQLHGSESPERVTEVRARYGLPVMKAIGIADESDLTAIDVYAQVADQLLVDTKPSKNTDRPGGNGDAFDWTLIAKRRWAVPWMLAGGLTQDNVAQAIATTGAQQIDLSSGVETAPGVKSAKLMQDFIAAARA